MRSAFSETIGGSGPPNKDPNTRDLVLGPKKKLLMAMAAECKDGNRRAR